MKKISELGYSTRIREIREKLGLNIAEFARQLSTPRSTLVGWEEGKTVSIEILKPLEIRFRVNIDWLLTGTGEMFLPQKEESPPMVAGLGAMLDRRLEKIEAQIAEIKGQLKGKGRDSPNSGMGVSDLEPEYAEDRVQITNVEGLAAGKPIFQSEVRSTVLVPRRLIKDKPEDYYVARIRGTSMREAGIPDGSRVLIRISDTPKDGAIQVVERQGEATLKRMREVPGKGWEICFDDGSGRHIEVGPGDEFHIQGDFVAVLPEDE